MRNLRKKFKKPRVSWETESIRENKKISEEFGLKRKREILITLDILRGYRRRARELIAEQDEEKEKLLMDKLAKLGMLSEGSGLDDVLALTIRDVLNRRLQSIVFSKGLATSPMHARQMIVHGNVIVNGKKTKFPSYLVPVDMEKTIKIIGGKPKPKEEKQEREKPEEEKAAEKGDSGKGDDDGKQEGAAPEAPKPEAGEAESAKKEEKK